MKKLIFLAFGDNFFTRFLNHPALSICIPAFTTMYYLTLDIWGDDFALIKNNIEFHQSAFLTLLFITSLVIIFKTISELLHSKVSKQKNEITKALIMLFKSLVNKKKRRFFDKAKHLKPTGDTFKAITHPKEQLEYVLAETKRFLVEAFGLDAKNIAITIIQGNPREDKWWYELRCETQRKYARARDIMNGNSTAATCFQSGDSLLIPDIRKGIKENMFEHSKRSRDAKQGSIYCKPVRITVNNCNYVYIFSIAVYGQNICPADSNEDFKACENVLDDIADRVELELYLHSMRKYRFQDISTSREGSANAEDIST
ncbi:hypothetical protein QT397_18105 [Microbulbifer sp. MKSA007]|nr:hypothetical protein QT397_18105 [Microbulbifer sp. MKSA007]